MLGRIEKLTIYFENLSNRKDYHKYVLYVFLINLSLYLLLDYLIFFIIFPDTPNNFLFNLGSIADNIIRNVLPISGVALTAVIFEEIVYRLPVSFLYKYKIDIKRRILGIFLLTIIFSVMHIESLGAYDILYVIPYAFIGGISTTIIYIISGGSRGEVLRPLAYAISTHFLMNIIFMSVQIIPEGFK